VASSDQFGLKPVNLGVDLGVFDAQRQELLAKRATVGLSCLGDGG
jgi:hypothetical protein